MPDSTELAGTLHHVEIYVSELRRSLDFWGWFLERLGYRQIQSWEGGASYLLHDTYIVFVQTGDRFKDVPYHRCRAGLNHLAFNAGSREAVDELTRLLEERGVTILYRDRHPHAGGEETYGVFFEDPDRIKVEFVAP